tara:strand:- start:19996 stop:20445 length:450 start_codon:yes stop_codon:yes gene_type:complete
MYQKTSNGKQEPRPIVRDKQTNPLLQMAVEKLEKELWVNEETGEIILGQGALQPYQLNQKVGTPPEETDDSANKIDKKMDEILGLLKTKNIYGESNSSENSNGELKAVDVDVKKQLKIGDVNSNKLESEEYENKSENKLDKLRKLRSGN